MEKKKYLKPIYEVEVVDLDDALGLISKESIMIYPPGIPMLIPGEKITKNIKIIVVIT